MDIHESMKTEIVIILVKCSYYLCVYLSMCVCVCVCVCAGTVSGFISSASAQSQRS